jgi:tetratricopeptide (TPR) repeat protein
MTKTNKKQKNKLRNSKISIFTSLISVVLFFHSCASFKNKNHPEYLSKKAVKKEQKSLEYTNSFFEAEKQKMLGNQKEAIAYFLHCLDLKPEAAAPAYEIANIAVYNKDLNSGVKFAQQAYSQNPENKWYIITLADIKKRQGKLDETIKLIDKLIKLDPNKQEYYLEKADIYILQNKPTKAIQQFEIIEKKFGKTEDLLYKKYQIFAQRGDFLNVRKALKELIKLNPAELTYYSLLAQSYMATGQTKEAKKVYDDLLKNAPGNGLTYLSLAEYYRYTGNEDSSVFFIKKSFESDDIQIENKVDILYKFFTQKQENGDFKPVTYELLNILKQKYPDNPQIYSASYDIKIEQKKYTEALNDVYHLTRLSPSNRKAWEQLLLLDVYTKKFDSLYVHSTEAIDLFPNIPEFYFEKASACYQLKRYTEAVKVAKNGLNYVIDNNAQKLSFYSILGDSFQQLKDYLNSEKYYEKALELDPLNDYILNNYSYYLSLRKSNLEKAEEMAKKVYERNPGNYNYADTYGWVLFQAGKYTKAVDILKKAVDNGGKESPVILEHYGDALFKTNKINEAVEIWKLAKDLSNTPSTLERKISERKL